MIVNSYFQNCNSIDDLKRGLESLLLQINKELNDKFDIIGGTVYGDVDVNGDISLTGSIVFDTTLTEGSWRIHTSGTDLFFQRYESSNWITKGIVSA